MTELNYFQNQLTFINFQNLTSIEAEMVRTWRNHPQVNKWMRHQDQISVSQHQKFLKSLKNQSTAVHWLVKEGTNYLGVINFTQIKNQTAELGIYLNPALIGQGYGRILFTNQIQLGFEKLGLQTINLEVMANNLAAIHLYQKFGFQFLNRTALELDNLLKMSLTVAKFK